MLKNALAFLQPQMLAAQELAASAEKFVSFAAFLSALVAIGEGDPLEDNTCIASQSGGGGSDYLWWKNFKEFGDAYAKYRQAESGHGQG
jgi:hypothetical protein